MLDPWSELYKNINIFYHVDHVSLFGMKNVFFPPLQIRLYYLKDFVKGVPLVGCKF